MLAGVAVVAAPYVGNLSSGPVLHERGAALSAVSGTQSPLLARGEGGAATSGGMHPQFADSDGSGGEGGAANITMLPRFA